MAISPSTKVETGAVAPWVEVWIDSASSGEFVLLLRPSNDSALEVLDPHEGLKRVATFQDYEEAVHWLNEEEYDLVEGRWCND